VDEVAGKGVLWKTALPNWGHGTPLVLGDRVFVTCEPDTMVCLDANTGKVLWQDPAGPVTYAPVGPVVAKSSTSGWAIYAGSAYAWPCSDGRLVFRVSGDSVAAYERDGRKVWQMRFVKSGGKGADSLPWDKAIGNWGQKTEAGGWVWAGGFGIKGHTSPLVCGKLLVYACQGGLLALDASTGARAWGPVREAHTSGYYDDTPLALTIGGRAVIVTSTGGVVDAVTGAFLGDAMPLQTPKEGGKGPYSPRWEKEPTDKYTLLGSSQGWFETAPVPTGREGVVVFGKLLWCAYDKAGKPLSASAPQMTAKDQMGGAGYRALPVRIGFDADGKVTSQPLWPEPVTVPYAEQGPHMTCAQDSLFITGPTLGRTYVVDMETGKVVHQANLVDTKTIPKKPDFADPKEQAALLRFGMTEQTVMDGGDGLFRMNQAAYARTFVDGDGRLWLSDRFGHFITMDTKAPWTVTRVGAVDHPKSWLSHATLVPVGDRLYYRSFGEMYCLGAK
jgi:outer membrane protein assembly factor BamB